MVRRMPAYLLPGYLEQRSDEKAERLLRNRTWVYVIHWQERGPTKVGVAANPLRRLSELQTGNPFPLKIFTAFGFLLRPHAFDLEQASHHRLRGCALSGEWLDVTPGQARDALLEGIRRLSLTAEPWEHTKKPKNTSDRRRAIAAMEEYNRLNKG